MPLRGRRTGSIPSLRLGDVRLADPAERSVDIDSGDGAGRQAPVVGVAILRDTNDSVFTQPEP